jgi:hypothetical protein
MRIEYATDPIHHGRVILVLGVRQGGQKPRVTVRDADVVRRAGAGQISGRRSGYPDFDLGYFDEVEGRVEAGPNPFHSKVLPMYPAVGVKVVVACFSVWLVLYPSAD